MSKPFSVNIKFLRKWLLFKPPYLIFFYVVFSVALGLTVCSVMGGGYDPKPELNLPEKFAPLYDSSSVRICHMSLKTT